MNELPGFVGQQTAAGGAAHFIVRQLHSMGTKTNVVRIPITENNSFSSIEDILCNVKLIPLDKEARKYDLYTIASQLSRDAMNGMGIHYPEYGIVASHSNAPMDKPILEVLHNGKKVYVPAPDIHLRIRRFVPEEAS